MNTINLNCSSKNDVNNTAPAFKGVLGKKLISEMEASGSYDPKKFTEAVKGAFGPKSEKVNDVIEELVNKVSSLTYENAHGKKTIAKQACDIKELTAENKSVTREHEHLREIIRAKDDAIAAKDKEIAEAKELAEKNAKYESMAKVKSIDKIGIVMPEEAIKTADDMVKHNKEAHDSMLEYLFTGKGQEKALEQISRNSVLAKARLDGVAEIDSVAQKLDEVTDNIGGVGFNAPNYVLNMISCAVEGNPKGTYLKSPAVKKQVETNAMGILTPLCNGKYFDDTPEFVHKTLTKTLDNAVEFHNNFSKGMKKLENRYPSSEKIQIETPYDIDKSIVTVKNCEDGRDIDWTYRQVSDYGGSNW